MNGLLDSQLYSWAEKVILGYGCQSTYVGIWINNRKDDRRVHCVLVITVMNINLSEYLVNIHKRRLISILQLKTAH